MWWHAWGLGSVGRRCASHKHTRNVMYCTCAMSSFGIKTHVIMFNSSVCTIWFVVCNTKLKSSKLVCSKIYFNILVLNTFIFSHDNLCFTTFLLDPFYVSHHPKYHVCIMHWTSDYGIIVLNLHHNSVFMYALQFVY